MKQFILPGVGLAMILCALFGCGNSTEDEVHLLPDGHIGPVLIIFDQPDGQPKEYEDGARIYKIPPGGVLETQFEPNYGSFSASYHYASDNSMIREIPDLTGREVQEAEEGLYVYQVAPGTTSRIEREENVTRTGETAFHYRRYVVGPLAEADSLAKQAERLLSRYVP